MYNLSQNNRMDQITFYLFGWGGVAQVRFVPKCLCFISECANDYYFPPECPESHQSCPGMPLHSHVFACGCGLSMSQTRCPLHVAFCLHAPRFLSSSFSTHARPLTPYTVPWCLPLFHNLLPLWLTPHLALPPEHFLSPMVLLGSSGLIVSFVVKAMSLLMINLCNEKCSHD